MTDIVIQRKRNYNEYKRLERLFTKKPHLFVDGSCLYTVNAGMDGIDYIIGTSKRGVVKGTRKYADMGVCNERVWLADEYKRLEKEA